MDAIIVAPSSTKNNGSEREPEMHQARKGSQRYFGMKSHVGVDAGSGLVHAVATRRPTSETSLGRESC